MSWNWFFWRRSGQPTLKELQANIARGEIAIAAQSEIVKRVVDDKNRHIEALTDRVRQARVSVENRLISDLSDGWGGHGNHG